MQGLRRVLVSNHPAPVKSHLSANPCLAAVINFGRVLPNFARPPDDFSLGGRTGVDARAYMDNWRLRIVPANISADDASQPEGKNWTPTRAQSWAWKSRPRPPSARRTGNYHGHERLGESLGAQGF
jgi:hypothetical protein